MPKLPTYTAQIGAAPAIGGARAQAPGDALGGFGRTLAKSADAILTSEEEKESRQALVASSEIRAKYSRALDEAVLTGGDTDKLKEQMQDEQSRIGDAFQTARGQSTLALYSAQSELGFDEQANRIRVQRAGAEARLEGQKFLNSASEIIRSNPGYLKEAEANASAFVATLRNVSPETRRELEQGLKKSLNMAAVVSAARVDPEGTKRKLEAGDWDLTPEQRETGIGKADTEIRAKRAEEAYARSVKEHEERERDDAARDKHFADIIAGSGSRRAIMDDADLRPATREHLIDYMRARAEAGVREPKSNPVVMRDLWLRIHAPDGDPRKIFNGDDIFKAVSAGQVNTTDANQLNVLVANQKDENNRTFGARVGGFMATIGRAMNGSPEYSNQPELAAAIQMELVSQLERQAATMRAEKKSPDSLLDPDSKDFFFKPGTLKATAEIVKQRARDAAPKLPDLRADPGAWQSIDNGALFIDPNGVQRTMSQELKNALLKQGPPAVQSVTGKIIGAE